MKQFATGAAIVGAAVLVAMGSAPAQAEPIPVDPGIGGGDRGLVVLEVAKGGGTVASTALVCPSGAGHHRGMDACGQLTAAGGDFHSLTAAGDVCTKLYDPVTLRAFGIWNGEFISYEREFGNLCEGVQATGGAVFDFS